MRRALYESNPRIVERRLTKFALYRATLNTIERDHLDNFVEAVRDALRRRGKQFGIQMAQELVMALIEFKAGLPGAGKGEAS